jgi:Delta7-sterol 5-desaturase
MPELLDVTAPVTPGAATSYFFLPLLRLLVQYTLLFGAAFALFWGSRQASVQRRKIQATMPTRADLRRELTYGISSLFVFSAVMTVTLVLARLGLFPRFRFELGGLRWTEYLLYFPAMVLVQDLYAYWAHRLLHTPLLFRSVHVVHHRSVTTTPLSAISFHPVEAVLVIGVLPLLMALFPMDLLLLLGFALFLALVGIRNELGYELHGRLFMRLRLHRLLGGALHHNLHHQRSDVHFGLSTALMDRLFGTTHPGYEGLLTRLVEGRGARQERSR